MNREILEDSGLYFITDRSLSRKTVIEDVEAAVRAGVRIVQYREKELSTKDIFEEAKRIREITKLSGVLLIVNDRVDIALAVYADGVHIGQDDMPYEKARELLGDDKIIGVTAHNVKEAVEAEQLGADYVGISPIFATATKKDAGKPAGIRLIEEVKEIIKIPFVAIGGINFENIGSVLDAGAKSVVTISAIVTKEDVEEECKKFIATIKNIA
jgi:thiamine-phosphate pyrophosphorylase|tara:strand:+ start:201 stop:839 length:639 start_codon:yes stop_codon:yes gene_type:complete